MKVCNLNNFEPTKTKEKARYVDKVVLQFINVDLQVVESKVVWQCLCQKYEM